MAALVQMLIQRGQLLPLQVLVVIMLVAVQVATMPTTAQVEQVVVAIQVHQELLILAVAVVDKLILGLVQEVAVL
jgi:hypothetical protein